MVVQTGNLVEPPKEDGTPGKWAVTQEWKMKVSSALTAEGCVALTFFLSSFFFFLCFVLQADRGDFQDVQRWQEDLAARD